VPIVLVGLVVIHFQEQVLIVDGRVVDVATRERIILLKKDILRKSEPFFSHLSVFLSGIEID
jgi:hypothetical protein